jgi:hypothetical protein
MALVAGGLSAPPVDAAGTTRYVAPTGNDRASGTRARPWRTIQRGITALRPGDTLVIRGGTYRERITSPRLRPGRSGARITVKNYPGERPVIAGVLWLRSTSYWTFRGINVTRGSSSESTAVRLQAPCDRTIVEKSTFRRMSSVALTVDGCRNVTIRNNGFNTTVGGIFAINARNVRVTGNRFKNIGNGTIGSGKSNYVQFNNVTGGYIARNRGLGGNTEDMISIYKSSGTSASNPLVIERNRLQGTNWTRGSGTGIIVGDGGGGNYVIVRRNSLLNPGKVGIQLINGRGIRVYRNTLYAAPRSPLPSANVGMSSWDGNPSAQVFDNRVYWRRNDRSENPYWWGHGTIRARDNSWHARGINVAAMRVRL